MSMWCDRKKKELELEAGSYESMNEMFKLHKTTNVSIIVWNNCSHFVCDEYKIGKKIDIIHVIRFIGQ